MTQQAHCPHCNSTFYSPDPSNGGAGRNKCLDCGMASPVAEWYVERVIAIRKIYDEDSSPLYIQQVGRFARPLPATAVPRLHTDKPAAPIRQYKDDDE